MSLLLAAIMIGGLLAPDAASADASGTADSAESVEHAQTGIGTLFTGLVDDIKHLPSLPNVIIALGGGALALAVHPADESLNATLRSRVTLAETLWKPGHIVGADYVEITGAAATFAFGRIFNAPKASHVGMDMLRAEILAEGITDVLKYTVQRERPDGSDNLSFPSGHSAGTFAIATVIERHLGWKMAVVGYTVATYVATSRLHDNAHYVSDVVFGAAIGTIAGRTVTRRQHDAWSVMPVLTQGGVAVMVTKLGP